MIDNAPSMAPSSHSSPRAASSVLRQRRRGSRPGAVVIFGVLTAASLSCVTAARVPGAAKIAVVECLKQDADQQDADQMIDLALELAGDAARFLLAHTSIDWTALAIKAVHEGSSVGQCAFVRFWAEMHPVGVAARTLDPDDSASALALVRSAAGGATFRLPGRDI